ncbi:dicarboxylate/amino acid:cation symporter [Caulobacter mirabilis]|uniref:Dicarboxylate/amino acid:cation symporter n=1 Tax=Caulobacter mirabilis TaxID=69666 RepID=A0A2D2B2D8_9CAUL|nr:dicarboxylate/amino acid:cation symporter [Caulobacter mirabilis]ATQ44387.1 dicarboxylate/amino acid:cation symporter [Caulobacter mirabilis]
MNRLFTFLIVASMVLGVGVGWVCHVTLDAEQAAQAATWFKVGTDVFLRLIKMIIAPLVFSTLVAGIAHMGDAASVGRVGAKTMGWFITASIFSLLLGLVMVHILQPGVGLTLPIPETASTGVDASKLTLQEFITHVFPSSIFDAMARNEILQIVVFSIFVGVAVASLDDKAPAILGLVEQMAAIMLKVTGYVMKAAPLAIFAALAGTVTKYGLDILGIYAKFIGGFYLSLGVLWGLLALAGFIIVGPRILKLLGMVRQPTLLAFATASSEAAYPRTLEELQKFGVNKKVASFVLPLGYSFNLDGSMMYCTFATLFIAQIYGVEMSIGQQITMLLLLMVTSKGMAGVPRASLVVIAATLAYFDLPEAGIALILAVDHLLDMGRSATNVVGNSVAAAVVAKWEGQLGDGEEEPEAKPAA